MVQLRHRLDFLDARVHLWLVDHSIALLRIALGAVFFAFGCLKFVPGLSPAEGLVTATTDLLTFGLVPGQVALVGTAVIECAVGLCLITKRWLRGAVVLLWLALAGILSPLLLLPGRLFDGPFAAPTLEGQYVLKDLILVAATLVVGSTVRGGRLIRSRRAGAQQGTALAHLTPSDKLAVLAEAGDGESTVADVCARHGIPEKTFYAWRNAATGALTDSADPSVLDERAAWEALVGHRGSRASVG